MGFIINFSAPLGWSAACTLRGHATPTANATARLELRRHVFIIFVAFITGLSFLRTVMFALS